MRTDLEADVLILLYDVARHMRTHADQMARDHGLTRAQWIILVRLARQPDLSQNELAALAEVAPITVARQARSATSRSEEHTSEIQSRQYLECRLLLEKKDNYLETRMCAGSVG